ncbi:hypothetical protein CR513_31708, partial [Mucuna pruriens]
MDTKIEAIKKNDTWELTSLPLGAKKVGVKWVYKTKANENGKIEKYKVSLVAKGYAQKHGINYTEVFAHVAHLEMIRLVISLPAQKGWTISLLDVRYAFFHGELNEEVYIEQPPRNIWLKKALYGLKHAPQALYGLKQAHEPGIFLIFTGDDEQMFLEFKNFMMHEFNTTDLEKMRYFLGLEVAQNQNGEVLERFDMDKCNSVNNPIVLGCKLTRDENGERDPTSN